MANFTAADVKRLREQTGAGMMDCKNALEEASGDLEAAVELLRLKGAKDVNKRAIRTAANGLVAAELDGTQAGVLVELQPPQMLGKISRAAAEQHALSFRCHAGRLLDPQQGLTCSRPAADQRTRHRPHPPQCTGLKFGQLNQLGLRVGNAGSQ